MATLPTNLVQNVATYNKAELGALQNTYVMIANANKQFMDFEKIQANLGTTVNMRLKSYFQATKGISTTLQGINQTIHALTVDDAYSLNTAVDDVQRVFNLPPELYMEEYGETAVQTVGAKIETAIAAHAHSAAPVNTFTRGLPVPTGALHTESGPYRFSGNGTTAIDSILLLDQYVRAFKNMGTVGKIRMIIPDTAVSSIVNSALSQFVLKRNEESAGSWDVGRLVATGIDVMTSNMLPVHTAGDIGNTASPNNVITITAITTDSNGNITGFTGTSSVTTSSQAVLSGDVMQFVDAVAGYGNMRFITHIGDQVSEQPVQIRSTSTGVASGGNVSFSIHPYLTANLATRSNTIKAVNRQVEVGMKLAVYPNHRCGLIIDDAALYLAMPQLPATPPYESVIATDKDSGASMRLWHGYIPNEGAYGLFRNCIIGATLIPDYCMRILFPAHI
jgi:hypothetical protein